MIPTSLDDPNLPADLRGNIRLGVIGGTGLLQLEDGVPIAKFDQLTPWGYPSAPIVVFKRGNLYVAFLARHGIHHQFGPHEIPSRANIAALRFLGVRSIIAFSAVGSLQEEVRPRDFIIPDQLIDRTLGVRASTFFGHGIVGHVGFAEPFDEGLSKIVSGCAGVLAGDNTQMHNKGTLICMEGPQFSTRAESNLYRAWGGTIINMSGIPEAKLAREAEIAYQTICMATDYDCWHSSGNVDVAMVMEHMTANSANAKRLLAAVLEELDKEMHLDLVKGTHLKGHTTEMLLSMTNPLGRSDRGIREMQYLFPDIWKDNE